jgi:putative phage-type endonuclease
MVEQGSQEWLQERLGHVTASRLSDVLATIKTGEAASCRNYRAELVAQRLTGNIESSFTNAAMQWGTDNEPIARSEYEVRTGVFVDQVGFIKHPTIEWSGASPDGLVGDSGLIEIKCPNTATHIDTLLTGKIPSQYENQMLWQIACTGREWCDFVSFDPRLPEELSYFCKRFTSTFEQIKEAEQAVILFLNEVQETINKLRSLNNGKR